MPEQKRLYRSQTDRYFAGICGGLASYLEVQPALIRLLLVILLMFGGAGLVVYLAALLVIPKEPSGAVQEASIVGRSGWKCSASNKRFAGVCGGIAEELGVDATPIRLLWANATVFSVGVGLLIYFLLALVLPVRGA